MRRLLILGSVIAGVIFGLIALSRVPMYQLEKVAYLYVAKVHGGRASTLRVLPREPFDENIDRVLALLPFCPSVKEFQFPPIRDLRPRLARIAQSWWVISLWVDRCNLEDDDIATLSGMTNLEWLDLTGNLKVTDAGIAHLAKCTQLRVLALKRTGVSGAGLAKLAECKELETLALADCPITDETVVLIPRFPKLVWLSLVDTKITEKELSHFVTWHRLNVLGVPNDIPAEACIEFNRQWLEAYRRARAAGEDLPAKARPPVYVGE